MFYFQKITLLFFIILLIPIPILADGNGTLENATQPPPIYYGNGYYNNGTTFYLGYPTYWNSQNNNYSSINTTIINYSSTQNEFQLYFSENLSLNNAVIAVYNGSNLTFSPESIFLLSDPQNTTTIQIPNILVSNSTISYQNIFNNNTTLNYTSDSRGIKESLILYTDPYPLSSSSDTFSFKQQFNYTNTTIYINNTIWNFEDIDTNATIDFRINGTILYNFSMPYADDAKGNRTYLMYNISKNNNILNITINTNTSWLHNATYPVTIDPSVIFTSDYTNILYSCFVSDPIRDQDCSGNYVKSGKYGGYLHRTFLKWNISTIPINHTVNNAYIHITSGTDTPYSVNTHEITSDWNTTTISWNNQPNINNTYESSVDVIGNYNWMDIPIANVFKKWYTGNPNYGITFRASDEITDTVYIYFVLNEPGFPNNRPSLVINISNNASYPTNFTIDYISNNTFVTNSTPFFNWINTDRENDTITSFNLQIWNGSNFTGTRFWNYVGTTQNYVTYAGTTLTQSNTYYASLKLNDSMTEGQFYNYSFYFDADPNYVPTLSGITLTPSTGKNNKTIYINATGISDSSSTWQLQTYYKNPGNISIANSTWINTSYINISITVPFTTGGNHTIYAVIYDSGNSTYQNNLTSSEVNANYTSNVTPPSIVESSLSTTSISIAENVTISTTVNGLGANISSVIVNIRRPDASSSNRTMTCGQGEIVNCTYTYDSTSDLGTYYIDYFYPSDYSGVNSGYSSSLSFIVSLAPTPTSTTSPGGGGGGSTTIIQPTPVPTSQTPIDVLQFNQTDIRSSESLNYLAKCLSTSLLLPNTCAKSGIIVVSDPTNWWILLGAWFSSITIVLAIAMIDDKPRAYFWDSAIYASITIILVLSLNLIGFNIWFVSYIFKSNLPGMMAVSMGLWAMVITVIGDSYSVGVKG